MEVKGSQMTQAEADDVLQRLRKLLDELPNRVPTEKEDIRREVLSLSDALKGVRELAKLKVSGLTTATAAQDRILAYLKLFVGVPVEGTELQVVGGIQEFARRVRELRVELGYKISTVYSAEDLRRGQYRLEKATPDEDEAKKWRTISTIRGLKGSALNRILELLKAFVGKRVTIDEISEVASIKEAARRVRQLRSEFGWKIVTRQTGQPDLPPGAYILKTLDQLPEHDREIPPDIYDQVLKRDGFKCQRCGWLVQDRHPDAKRQFLEVHHIIHHAKKGTNNPDNLITLCNVDHDDLHKAKIDGGGDEFKNWLDRGRK
jgi:hypothetical protein